jgi:DNA modification methylase
MTSKTFIVLDNRKRSRLPRRFRRQDVRFTSALVRHFLKMYTQPGDGVLDPFTGFGTTLLVAEKMGRIAYGVEFDAERADYVRRLLRQPEHLIYGDSLKIEKYGFPRIDFCLTSPPYTAREHKPNPLTAYRTKGKGYTRYLRDIGTIYAKIARLMKPGGHVVVEVSNIKTKQVTTLAWDIERAIARSLVFEGETIVGWKGGYGNGYDHSYCLVFRR